LAKLEWTRTVLSDLERLDTLIARRIIKKVTWYVNNFLNMTPEPLSKKMKGLFKFRVGDWRVIYTLEDDTIVIQFVGHRSKIYKRIK